MSIPNTNTFSLNDVRVELGLGLPTSLGACFSTAFDGSFDPSYKGAKDRLSNFRNYGAADPLTVSPNPISIGNSNVLQAVTVTTGSGISWTAVEDPTAIWFSISAGSGTGSGSFSVSYTAFINEGRVGNIRVQTSGGTIVNLTVNEIT